LLRRWWVLLSIPVICAQSQPPVQILKGDLIEWEVRGLTGEMAVRGLDFRVERCRVTQDTFITRQTMRIAPVGVRVGDHVEVVGDYRLGPSTCTAVTVYVRPPEVPRRVGHLPPLPRLTASSVLDSWWSRGNLTFSGVVRGLEDKRMLLRTRSRGEKWFAVREDTVFNDSGRLVKAGALEVYTRVFVRASLGIDGVLEARQIVWGEIFSPK